MAAFIATGRVSPRRDEGIVPYRSNRRAWPLPQNS